MKVKILMVVLICFVQPIAGYGQFVTRNSLYVKTGTIFSVDSLVLVPAEDLNLGSNYLLQVHHTAVPGDPNPSIKKTYIFNNPVNFEGNVGVIYHPSQLNGNDENLLEIANSYSDQSSWTTITGCAKNPAKHFVSKDVSDLDIRILTLVSAQTALPVTLMKFYAAKCEQSISLSWETSEEINSETFEIQHSTDGKSWRRIGTVAAIGESKITHVYGFEDINPRMGQNYYRLKMIDQDGAFSLSQIKKVFWENESLTIFPNPVSDKLEIDVRDWSQVSKIVLFNEKGAMMNEWTGLAGRELDLRYFSAGTYLLKIAYQDGSSVSRKVVKN